MSKTRTCYEESESRRQSMGWINTDLLQQQLGPKIKDTSLELMKMYIFICAHVQRKKTSIHSPTWKLKQNKCTDTYSKWGNTPRKRWSKSIQFKRIHVLTSFCLASDPQRKNVSHACRSIWKRPNSRQPVFRPEVPLAPSTTKQLVREAKFNLKKLYRLKRKLLHSHWLIRKKKCFWRNTSLNSWCWRFQKQEKTHHNWLPWRASPLCREYTPYIMDSPSFRNP